jgi:hypothetical protein
MLFQAGICIFSPYILWAILMKISKIPAVIPMICCINKLTLLYYFFVALEPVFCFIGWPKLINNKHYFEINLTNARLPRVCFGPGRTARKHPSY